MAATAPAALGGKLQAVSIADVACTGEITAASRGGIGIPTPLQSAANLAARQLKPAAAITRITGAPTRAAKGTGTAAGSSLFYEATAFCKLTNFSAAAVAERGNSLAQEEGTFPALITGAPLSVSATILAAREILSRGTGTVSLPSA